MAQQVTKDEPSVMPHLVLGGKGGFSFSRRTATINIVSPQSCPERCRERAKRGFESVVLNLWTQRLKRYSFGRVTSRNRKDRLN